VIALGCGRSRECRLARSCSIPPLGDVDRIRTRECARWMGREGQLRDLLPGFRTAVGSDDGARVDPGVAGIHIGAR